MIKKTCQCDVAKHLNCLLHALLSDLLLLYDPRLAQKYVASPPAYPVESSCMLLPGFCLCRMSSIQANLGQQLKSQGLGTHSNLIQLPDSQLSHQQSWQTPQPLVLILPRTTQKVIALFVPAADCMSADMSLYTSAVAAGFLPNITDMLADVKEKVGQCPGKPPSPPFPGVAFPNAVHRKLSKVRLLIDKEIFCCTVCLFATYATASCPSIQSCTPACNMCMLLSPGSNPRKRRHVTSAVQR